MVEYIMSIHYQPYTMLHPISTIQIIDSIQQFILDFTSRAGWPRRNFCGWIILTMCNYHTLGHLMWRSHHFPGNRESEKSDRNENVTRGTPFWTAKMALSKGKREIPSPRMDLKTCAGRTPDAGQTHMIF